MLRIDNRNPYLHVLISIICALTVITVIVIIPIYFLTLPGYEEKDPTRILSGNKPIDFIITTFVLFMGILGSAGVVGIVLLLIAFISIRGLESADIAYNHFLRKIPESKESDEAEKIKSD